MKPYSQRKFYGWSHYGRRAIKRLRNKGLWDDLESGDLNKSAARREAREEAEAEAFQDPLAVPESLD